MRREFTFPGKQALDTWVNRLFSNHSKLKGQPRPGSDSFPISFESGPFARASPFLSFVWNPLRRQFQFHRTVQPLRKIDRIADPHL
jgi:hypothetical protein